MRQRRRLQSESEKFMSQNESKEVWVELNEDEAEEKLTQQINAITPATTNDSITPICQENKVSYNTVNENVICILTRHKQIICGTYIVNNIFKIYDNFDNAVADLPW